MTGAGRGVAVLDSFRAAAEKLKLGVRFVGTGNTELNAALQLCDKGFVVKAANDATYIRAMEKIVAAEKADLLAPVSNHDLMALSKGRERLEQLGCRVLVSKSDVIATCLDNIETCKFLETNGFSTPKTLTARQALAGKLKYPMFVKSRRRSEKFSGVLARNREELALYTGRAPDAVVQPFIAGTEYMCDVYVDLGMNVRCVVPRARIYRQRHEMLKEQAVKDAEIMETAAEVVRKLGAGPGLAVVRCIREPKGKLWVISISARVEIGSTLSVAAGADYPRWILEEITGGKPRIRFDGFKDGMIMLWHDREVYLSCEP